MSRGGRGGGALAAAVVMAVGGYLMASLTGAVGVEDVDHVEGCPDLRGRTVVHEQGPDGTAYTLDNVLVGATATTCTYRGAAHFGGPRGGESRGAYTFHRLRGGGPGSADDRSSVVVPR